MHLDVFIVKYDLKHYHCTVYDLLNYVIFYDQNGDIIQLI